MVFTLHRKLGQELTFNFCVLFVCELKSIETRLVEKCALMKSEACYLRLERLVIFLSFKVVPAGST